MKKSGWLMLMFIVCVFALSWILSGGFARFIAEIRSRKAYLSSRSGLPNSIEFIVAGITNGMPSQNVDTLFQQRGCEEMRGFPLEDGWFQNLYIWRHGKVWRPQFGDNRINLYEEWFFVTFDRENKARRVKRFVANASDPLITANVEIDLQWASPGSHPRNQQLSDEKTDKSR